MNLKVCPDDEEEKVLLKRPSVKNTTHTNTLSITTHTIVMVTVSEGKGVFKETYDAKFTLCISSYFHASLCRSYQHSVNDHKQLGVVLTWFCDVITSPSRTRTSSVSPITWQNFTRKISGRFGVQILDLRSTCHRKSDRKCCAAMHDSLLLVPPTQKQSRLCVCVFVYFTDTKRQTEPQTCK